MHNVTFFIHINLSSCVILKLSFDFEDLMVNTKACV